MSCLEIKCLRICAQLNPAPGPEEAKKTERAYQEYTHERINYVAFFMQLNRSYSFGNVLNAVQLDARFTQPLRQHFALLSDASKR